MEEHRGIASAVASEPASNSGLLSERRNRNELGSTRVKVRDLDSDAKPSNMKSDGNIGIVQKPNLSSEHKSVAPDAEGLGRVVVQENEVLANDTKPSTVLETIKCDDDRRVANSEKQALVETHTVKGDSKSESAEADLLQMSNAMTRWMEMKKHGFLSNR